jgi:hypothetical protein
LPRTLTIGVVLPPAVAAAAAGLLALAGLALLRRYRRDLDGTTLVAVWCWSAVSTAFVAAAEIVIAVAGAQGAPPWVVPLRLAAAAGTFCPAIALLGAKRPQDRGWQFIVAALWGILSLPSMHWLLFGGPREMHPAQLGFVALLIGVAALNGIATRYWPTSLLYAGGQAALVAPFFPLTDAWLPRSIGPLVGLALIVAAYALRALHVPRARSAPTALDRAWLDFRDQFGAVWGLRIMERINAAAAMYGWGISLGWQGFVARDNQTDVAAIPPAVEDSLRTLLRRFVSPEWIDRRLTSGGAARVEDRAIV